MAGNYSLCTFFPTSHLTSFSPCLHVPCERRLLYNNNVQTLCCRIFMLIYFCKTLAIQKYAEIAYHWRQLHTLYEPHEPHSRVGTHESKLQPNTENWLKCMEWAIFQAWALFYKITIINLATSKLQHTIASDACILTEITSSRIGALHQTVAAVH